MVVDLGTAYSSEIALSLKMKGRIPGMVEMFKPQLTDNEVLEPADIKFLKSNTTLITGMLKSHNII